VWDKAPTKLYGACRILEETHAVNDLIFSSRFSLWGWGRSPSCAKAIVADCLLDLADNAGILKDAVKAGVLPKWLTKSREWQARLHTDFPPPLPPELPIPPGGSNETRGTTEPPTNSPPAIFSILKWKSVEKGSPATAATLKWRDVISFKRHHLKRYAKLVSRSLQLLVQNVCQHATTSTLPNMLGIRDLVGCISRLKPVWENTSLHELDMDDQFWNIPKEECVEAVRWAVKEVTKHRRCRGLSFALHKGGDKFLDRFGSSTERDFVNLTVGEVLRYVQWDTMENGLFTLGALILA
jgi:hypothetical protein